VVARAQPAEAETPVTKTGRGDPAIDPSNAKWLEVGLPVLGLAPYA